MSELGVVVRNIQRADAAAVERLSRLGVSTIHEAQGRLGNMRPYMRPAWKGARSCGTALTVLAHPGDNWMMHVVADVAQPGDLVASPPTIPTVCSATCSPPPSRRAASRGW